MNVRGRRHWTERVTFHEVTRVTSGPDTGAEAWSPLVSDPVQATVQPVSNAEAIRHGITTDQPLYWLRVEGIALRVGDGVMWNGQRYKIITLSRAPDIDTQAMMELLP